MVLVKKNLEWVMSLGLACAVGGCSGDDTAVGESQSSTGSESDSSSSSTTGTSDATVGESETDGGSGSASSDTGTTTDTTTDATTDTTTDATTDTTTDATTDTTTDSTTDTTGVMTGGPTCGDGNVDDGEECDDGNDDESDACLSNCVAAVCGDGQVQADVEECDDGNGDETDDCTSLCAAPACDDGILSGDESDVDCGGSCDACDLGAVCGNSDDCGMGICDEGVCAILASCKAILAADPDAGSGAYTIDVDGEGEIEPFEVQCDMETDGGGFTELTLKNACDNLQAVMDFDVQAPIEGIDEECRPFTRDAGGNHSYHYTIPFPPGFTEFYLHEYVMKANAGPNHTSDLFTNWTQTLWTLAYIAGGRGDISFGSAEEAGPVTSYSQTLPGNVSCLDCETAWPGMMDIYQTGMESKAFRIGWGEGGGEAEGWFPWWSGTIRVR